MIASSTQLPGEQYKLQVCYAIDSINCLGDLDASDIGEEVPGSIPRFDKDFYICFVAVVVVFTLFYQTHYLSLYFAILFAMFFHLVFLTYCKLGDQ